MKDFEGEFVVNCELCDKPTSMTSTKRCDRCWELERRVQMDPALTRKILERMKYEETETFNTPQSS